VHSSLLGDTDVFASSYSSHVRSVSGAVVCVAIVINEVVSTLGSRPHTPVEVLKLLVRNTHTSVDNVNVDTLASVEVLVRA